jgi:hypothetical protein
MMKTLEVFRAPENDYTVDCPEQDFSNALWEAGGRGSKPVCW